MRGGAQICTQDKWEESWGRVTQDEGVQKGSSGKGRQVSFEDCELF